MVVGDDIFFVGVPNEKFVYGCKGITIGPAGDGELAVLFEDEVIACRIKHLSREPPCLEFAAGYKLNDEVVFTGSPQDVGGDRLEVGTRGIVVAPGSEGKVL